MTFEQAEAELRKIVERLEAGDVAIDEAIALWERGEALYKICREQLDAAEGKVEELTARCKQPSRLHRIQSCGLADTGTTTMRRQQRTCRASQAR